MPKLTLEGDDDGSEEESQEKSSEKEISQEEVVEVRREPGNTGSRLWFTSQRGAFPSAISASFPDPNSRCSPTGEGVARLIKKHL